MKRTSTSELLDFEGNFLKRLYVGDVAVSNIFRVVDESSGAFQKRLGREVDGVKFSNREIIIEWFAYMFCNRLDPRVKAFADEIRDRDLSAWQIRCD